MTHIEKCKNTAVADCRILDGHVLVFLQSVQEVFTIELQEPQG